MIFDHAVRVENIGTDLTPPSNIRLFAANRIKLFLLLFQLALVQFGTKHRHRTFPVFDLRAFILTRYNDSCRNMRNPHGRIGRIDMLTTCTTRTVRIDLQILSPNFDIDIVGNFRHNITGNKRSMSSARCIKRRNSYQAMYTLLCFEVSVCIEAFYQQGNAFDSCLISRQIIQCLHLKATFLCPTSIHPQQHLAPILRLCSTCTRMQFKNSIHLIVRLIQQKTKLELLQFAHNGCNGRAYF
ncbi:hypothetical protein D1872_249430 [compost metagenome]